MKFLKTLLNIGADLQRIIGGQMTIKWAGGTHPGKIREKNEDCYGGFAEDSLWLVCDGLGGGTAGEAASRLAVSTIHSEFCRHGSLTEAILAADQEICHMQSTEELGRHRPGSTVVALSLRDGTWQIAWVGDSRGWIFQGKEAKQVTIDHTVVQQLVSWGEISASEAHNHPERHKLSQALGLGEKHPVVSHAEGQCRSETVFLLASDGLAFWEQPDRLFAIINTSSNGEDAVQRLIDASLATGGSDNITCIVIRVGKEAGNKVGGRKGA